PRRRSSKDAYASSFVLLRRNRDQADFAAGGVDDARPQARWEVPMTRSLAAAAVAMSMLMVAVLAPQAAATHLGPTYCGPTIPADEATGTVAFPRGDVFCPLLADPKTEGSFVSYLRGKSSSAFGTDLGAAGIGDRFGLVRWNGRTPGMGAELSLAANVYTQFDFNTASYDLINADYVVGLPITFRWNRFSARLRLYHQSSHLGDEFVLRGG